MAGLWIRKLDVYRISGGALVGALTLLMLGCGGTAVTQSAPPPPPPPGNTDTTPPSVSVTAPTNGASVTGRQTLSATASDNVGVASVQFQLDGSNLGAAVVAAPFSMVWDTTVTSNGSHTLTSVARDAAGNSTTSGAVSVTVNNGPVVQITTNSLSSGALGFAYNALLTAAGGSGSYSWSLFGGQLPSGIVLSSATGTLSGVPTVAGLFTFIIEARDSAGVTGSATFSLGVSSPTSVYLPAAGSCYTDPVTGNRVCRVTDRVLCSRAGHHYYSYWPVWNANGSHLVVECNGWAGAPGAFSNALLIRDSDLAVVGDATPPGASSTLELFWSATDPNILYFASGTRVLAFNPFTRGTPTIVADFAGSSAGGVNTSSVRLAYVSFDDRYVLVELTGAGGQFGLATFDRMATPGNQIRTLSTRDIYTFFDEAVLTQGNRVWSIGDLGAPTGTASRSYAIDFSSFVTSSDHGHHAHGLLPNGTPVAVKEASNRSCPAGSASGIPGSTWKPTALVLNELVNSPDLAADPLAAELWKLACQVPGQHELTHYSWNHTQRDRFFVSSFSYSGAATDPLADALLRVRLQFDPAGNLTGDAFDVIAPHRSEKKYGYFALPRPTCNRQGTRCLFSSSMSVGTTNTDFQEHLYVVDVP